MCGCRLPLPPPPIDSMRDANKHDAGGKGAAACTQLSPSVPHPLQGRRGTTTPSFAMWSGVFLTPSGRSCWRYKYLHAPAPHVTGSLLP
jgi:hypothetical protein